MSAGRALAIGLAAALAGATGACYDPAHHDAVALLGPEASGVPEGPSHRPGQPCTTCHGGKGPADLELSVAGTLFRVRGRSAPLQGGTVTVTDALGDTRTFVSNAVGNFFVPKSEWDPSFPLKPVLEAEGIRREMVTFVGQDGSCATCHRDAGDTSRMPGVFLRDK